MGPRSKILSALVAVACGLALAAPAFAGAPFVISASHQQAVVWAVGDGADGGTGGRAVAELIATRGLDRFLYLGDVYESGTLDEFGSNYAPLFGRFDPIAAPTPGNHEYGNLDVGYEPYWERARGRTPPLWYSFSAGGWQILSLDSMSPLEPGSPQLSWLRSRLRRTPRFGTCRIAFTHKPRYSAGMHGDEPELEPLWRTLAGRARILLAGHDHHMQRNAPIDGIVQFVSGAGGHALRDANAEDPHAAFVEDGRDGALRLGLRPRRALASFLAADGELLDRKRIRCHRP